MSIFCCLYSSDAAKENIVPLPEYDVFKDAAFQQPQRSRSSTLVSAQGQGQSTGGVAATGVQNWEALVSVELLRTAYFPVVSTTSSEAISIHRVACFNASMCAGYAVTT
jgi:hypothetical protein